MVDICMLSHGVFIICLLGHDVGISLSLFSDLPTSVFCDDGTVSVFPDELARLLCALFALCHARLLLHFARLPCPLHFCILQTDHGAWISLHLSIWVILCLVLRDSDLCLMKAVGSGEHACPVPLSSPCPRHKNIGFIKLLLSLLSRHTSQPKPLPHPTPL